MAIPRGSSPRQWLPAARRTGAAGAAFPALAVCGCAGKSGRLPQGTIPTSRAVGMSNRATISDMTNEACLCGNTIPDHPARCTKCGLMMCDACNTLAQQPGRSHARGLGPECNPDILAARRDDNTITSNNPGRELRTPIEP